MNFDPSYISRMRTGKRGVPNHHPFIEPAARFFAHRITEDHQKASLSEILLSGDSWPEDPDTARLLIAAWLNDNTPAYRDTLSRLMQKLSQPELSLKTFSSPDPEAPSQGTRPAQRPAEPVHREPVSFFYGKEGKRTAFLSMMDHVLSREEPGTLLLHILIHDRKAIRAIEKEFHDFQELCRPLMQSRILSSPAELPGEIRSYACNFNLVSTLPKNIELYVDEEKGVAVFRNTPPYLLFTTTEPHITRSFMDYWLLYHE